MLLENAPLITPLTCGATVGGWGVEVGVLAPPGCAVAVAAGGVVPVPPERGVFVPGVSKPLITAVTVAALTVP